MPRIVYNAYSEELFNCPDFSSLCRDDGNCKRRKCRFRHIKNNPRDPGMNKEKKIRQKNKEKRKRARMKKKQQRLKKKIKKMNAKKNKNSEKMKDILKKKGDALPRCKGLREYMLEEEVESWSHGENKVLISIHEIKKELFSVKVGVKLDGEIVKTVCKVDEDVGVAIETLCLDIHVLLSKFEPYNRHFNCKLNFI